LLGRSGHSGRRRRGHRWCRRLGSHRIGSWWHGRRLSGRFCLRRWRWRRRCGRQSGCLIFHRCPAFQVALGDQRHANCIVGAPCSPKPPRCTRMDLNEKHGMQRDRNDEEPEEAAILGRSSGRVRPGAGIGGIKVQCCGGVCHCPQLARFAALRNAVRRAPPCTRANPGTTPTRKCSIPRAMTVR
jgi:hypothetical protein